MAKKTAAFVLCILLMFGAGGPAALAAGTVKAAENTAEGSSGLALKAKSVVLMEESTGKVLYQSNEHEKLQPASITKIMTELLVLEAIEAGRLKFTDKITCSAHAASMGGSDIWLEPGEVMTVDELFRAMAISSANDAAVALAEKVAGTDKAFVNEMNTKAKELGMNDTHFINVNGLDADGHVTSAYDVALMSRELLKHKAIFKYCTVWMDSLRGGKTQLANTNKLIRFYQGANGLKTGYTHGSGYGISATAKRGGMQLIAVVMGEESSKQRNADAEKLLDYGFTNWAVVTPAAVKQKLTVRVLRGEKTFVEAVPAGSASLLVDKALENKIEQKPGLVGDVMAPVEKGQILGQIYLSAGGKSVGSIPLVARNAVGRMTFLLAFTRLFRALVRG